MRDAQRQVHVAADALRGELTFLAQGSAGERRASAGSATEANAHLRPDEGNYSALIDVDIPLERTAQRNAYRTSLIGMEQAVRNLQATEDRLKLEVRNDLRNLGTGGRTC